ncbi:uncharacterized protein LOC128553893 isoform X2 [Mercenaria mercenaria]|uniref:uncharacterized protein LOC128553893 isoform X2 n=1 Tax=Mercenaria mercenaria TaxID=6596 RepID=UPI00234F10B1|nr:uncharacterized protein LOC128553893 isoform X2 [Mercenaria mercenaria]
MTLSKFSKVKCKNFKMPESNSFQGRVYWEEKSSHTLPLEFDGVPFVIIGSQVRECVNGPDRHRSEKKKHSEKQQEEHGYTVMGKKRCLLQTTKKMNCSAAIHLRYIVKFPEFKLNNNTKWVRKKQGKELKEAMKRGNVVAEHRVYVCFPSNEDHIGHLTEEFGLMSQRVDKSIISKIHMLVGEGVTNAAEMKRHLSIFCKTQHPEMPECSRRFYPSNKDIRNHMYRAMRLTQFSSEDQENLLQCVNKWKLENPSDHYFFNPSPSDTDEEDTDRAFIFVHQTWWQQVLLRRYGNEICLLDATYKTSKYDIPLFFVCVSTNVGYSIVGTFLIPNEKTESIQRGLRVLQEWNVDWKPAYFMTDYDIKEIAAIENTFPGTVKVT